VFFFFFVLEKLIYYSIKMNKEYQKLVVVFFKEQLPRQKEQKLQCPPQLQ